MARRSHAAWLGVAALVLLTAFLPARAGASHSQLELISTGPNGGNAAIGALLSGTSTDGERAFFATTESLVTSDSDSCPLFSPPRACFDVYERMGATTTLLSTGPSGGNGEFDARFEAASADGLRVYFASAEPLTPEDTDNMCQGTTGPAPCRDIYERFGGTTSLVSTGPGRGNGPFIRYFANLSEDGTRALFGASDGLSGADSDQSEDLYERAAGATALMSTGPSGGNGAFDALLSGASADGTHVFFRTSESLVSSDTDSAGDVYERFAGTTTRVSTGPSGGNGTASSAFEASSRDGSKVFFSTEEALVAADADSAEDVYERSGGNTTLVSTGPSGNGTQNAIFAGTSTDGSRVFFRTRSSLVGADSDSSVDLYERAGGSTALVSTGATGGNGAFDAYFADASADGSRVFFTTDETLAAGDTDSLQDIYERQGSTTTLISTGPSGGNGSHVAFFAAASNDGTRVFFHTGEQLTSGDTDTFLDIYASRALTGYARPRGATPTMIRLVPAFEPCSSPNGTHGTPLAVTSCSPPVPSSAHLTVGTPDSNGQPPKLVGYVDLKTICSPPAPGPSPPCTDPGEQGDVQIEIGITDVRRQSDLSDYGGELQSQMQIRMTDRVNGASLGDPGTAMNVPFSIPVPCMPNADATEGSSCNLTTTADAVLAGMVVESKRSIWQLGQIEVRDGGADGDADTAPNTPFLHQGLFAP